MIPTNRRVEAALKACLWCDSDGADVWGPDWRDGRCYAFCLACQARGPSGDSREDAAERWNRRAPEPAKE